jgi:DNA-binding NtrC family response regulator
MTAATIVVADDEALQRRTLAGFLAKAGHKVVEAASGEEAVSAVEAGPVDLVLTDLRMPGLSGMDVVRRVKAVQPEVGVVVLTAFGTVRGAVEAMKAGAADYLTKPVDLDELELVVARLLETRDLVRENRELRRRLEESTAGFRLLGRSPALREVLSLAVRVAETDATVLIRGESGTGKELLARSIHTLGRRAGGPFVALNCAALPETLLESELFGHEKGAFTGAERRHRGRVEAAEGGTLFLDEIGDVPLPVQVKLLRFLQEREYTPVGGERALPADVRVMAATHRDLEALMRDGAFREDLFYRLNVVSLTLPPLRDRREDVPELIEHFLERFARRHDRPVTQASREATDALIKYAYPGNVRELENIVEQAVILARGETITVADLPLAVRRAEAPDRADPLSLEAVEGNLPGVLDDLERRIVLEALAREGGNQSETARRLGLTESGLRYKLKRWQEAE